MTKKQRAAYDRLKASGHFKRVGLIGGMKTRRRLITDPDYYARQGKLGGEAILEERGKEYFSQIGSLPKKRKEET